jgi:hypothetical protein
MNEHPLDALQKTQLTEEPAVFAPHQLGTCFEYEFSGQPAAMPAGPIQDGYPQQRG